MPGRFGPSPHPAVHPTADRMLLRRKSITVRLQQDDLCARLQLCPAPRLRALARLDHAPTHFIRCVWPRWGCYKEVSGNRLPPGKPATWPEDDQWLRMRPVYIFPAPNFPIAPWDFWGRGRKTTLGLG